MKLPINTEPTPLRKSNIRDLIKKLQNKRYIQLHSNFPKKMFNPQSISITLRKSWKDGGYGNKQFNQLFPLRAKILNEWEIQRIPLSKRSYSCPKNFKGYKFDSCSRQLDIKNQKEMHSEDFNRYLTKIKQKYEQIIFLPKPTDIINKIQKVKSLNNTGMKFKSTTSLFGSPNLLQKRPERIKSFKSEILNKKSHFN